jgi:two-component system, chemotaxis family, chemotaxis protein CheY
MKHCLIVDDSRIIRRVARKIFEELQFATEECEDGEAALELCRKQMPDAILLDSHLPNMTSVELVRALRREPDGGKPMVVYATVENDIALITEAIGAGANDYILKPFDQEIVAAKLADIGLI